MTDIANRTGMPGVQFAPPPTPILDSIHAKVQAILPGIRPENNNAIVLIPTERGVNAAIVTRNDHATATLDWTVTGYIGKSWGEPLEVGGIIQLEWP